MKRYQVIILASAERDIGEAYEWLAGQDESAAIRWYNRLLEAVTSLDTFPERCPLAPESKFFPVEVREIFHGRRRHKYRVLFTVKGDRVYVLHVRHGARLTLGETETSD